MLPAQVVRPIEFTGLAMPLLSLGAEPSHVVLGNRRAAAVKVMKHVDEIPLFVAHNPAELARWCEADKELERWNQGPGGLPWSWRQMGAALDAVLGGLSSHGAGGTAAARAPGPTDVLAAYFDVHEVQLRNAMYLLRFERIGGPEGERATQALDLVEAGELKAQTAFRKLRDGAPMEYGVGAIRPAATVAQQVKAIRKAGDALAGITHGLKAIGDVDPAMPAETRAELARPIQEARAVIARLARQLGTTESNTDKGEGS
jgi:hypothetical protein